MHIRPYLPYFSQTFLQFCIKVYLRSGLSTRVSNSDQPARHTRKHYTNINCHNLHTYPRYIIAHIDIVMTDKPYKPHGMEAYSHGGLEEPNHARQKTESGETKTWNVTGNRELNKETCNQKGVLFNLLLTYVIKIIH